jgi:hypothetical protein
MISRWFAELSVLGLLDATPSRQLAQAAGDIMAKCSTSLQLSLACAASGVKNCEALQG